MSLNYPLDPDRSFESFLITTSADQQAVFGQVFSQNELVPMNYNKILQACVGGTLTYSPLREIIYVSDTNTFRFFRMESINNAQGTALKNAFIEAYNYWQRSLLLIPQFQCPMGIVTEIVSTLLSDSSIPQITNTFQLQIKLKINWLTIPEKSIYA